MDFLSDDVFAEMFPNELNCIKLLVSMGVFHSIVTCSLCGDDMELLLTEKKRVFRCPRRRCGYREVSYRFASVFLGKHAEIASDHEHCALLAQGRNP